MRKRRLLVPVLVLAAAQGSVASADPVHAFDRLAHPVRSTQAHGSLADLRPFGRDFVLDLRTVPDATWLHTARPTRSIGTNYPTPDVDTALAVSYDVVIHLHEVHRARPF